MKNFKVILLTIFGFSLMGLTHIQTKQTATFELNDWVNQMNQIHKLELDLAGIDLKNKQVDLVISGDEIDHLKKIGFKLIEVNSG